MTGLEEHVFKYGEDRTTLYLTAGPADGPLLVFIHGWPAIAKTWKPQLLVFASFGFRVVAPDMPGYGGSTARKIAEDYSLENINKSMLALLEEVGRRQAVWLGHDWGAPAVWSFAAHYPEHCVAVVGMAVPYGAIEFGFEDLIKTVNRDVYPKDQYPYGQWDYQNFYRQDFEKATAWFDANPAAVLRAFYAKRGPEDYGKPVFTSTVTKDGGWFGGIEKPDPNWEHIPSEMMLIDEATYQELVAAMKKTGFWSADAWYSNHERNRDYTLQKAKDEARLSMPVLFINAQFDGVCSVTQSQKLAEPMRRLCSDLTECTIGGGHWIAAEKPAETNAAIARWLVERCVSHWPGHWTATHVRVRG